MYTQSQINVRGKDKYIILDMERYLREARDNISSTLFILSHIFERVGIILDIS